MNLNKEPDLKQGFISKTSTLIINTSSAPEFIDITEKIIDIVDNTKISDGTITIYSRHTTSAIVIQENEPLLLNDMASLLEKLSPKNSRYGHNDFTIRTVNMNEGEPPNGHSHCQHLILGSSETIPVANGLLTLGQWQRIFVVELDESKITPREIVVQIMGI
ncbi:MAG: YjbQ family protein [SAR202 cluster bacterium]|nr:YjbQ family protein [SAR202 cluster bacterium]|tara:strand:- start:45762 stop:46247 length:486 start_codon:yes stop_codon:yes gene_type:complete